MVPPSPPKFVLLTRFCHACEAKTQEDSHIDHLSSISPRACSEFRSEEGGLARSLSASLCCLHGLAPRRAAMHTAKSPCTGARSSNGTTDTSNSSIGPHCPATSTLERNKLPPSPRRRPRTRVSPRRSSPSMPVDRGPERLSKRWEVPKCHRSEAARAACTGGNGALARRGVAGPTAATPRDRMVDADTNQSRRYLAACLLAALGASLRPTMDGPEGAKMPNHAGHRDPAAYKLWGTVDVPCEYGAGRCPTDGACSSPSTEGRECAQTVAHTADRPPARDANRRDLLQYSNRWDSGRPRAGHTTVNR